MRSDNEIRIRNKDIDAQIIKHIYGEIWLGNVANMNDKSEIKYFIQKMLNTIHEDIWFPKISQPPKFLHNI